MLIFAISIFYSYSYFWLFPSTEAVFSLKS